MNEDEAQIIVTERLLLALETSDKYPPAGMAFCRLAAECIAHYIHYQDHGVFPTDKQKGEYPGLPSVINKLKNLDKQTSEIFYSVNAQTRSSLHWDFESKDDEIRGHHVKSVVSQISSLFSVVFGNDLALSGMKISDERRNQVLKDSIFEERGPRDNRETHPSYDDEEVIRILQDSLAIAEYAEVESGMDPSDWKEYVERFEDSVEEVIDYALKSDDQNMADLANETESLHIENAQLRAENLVLEHQKIILTQASREDLAAKVSKVTNHRKGYDIESFNESGEPRRIEVKSSLTTIAKWDHSPQGIVKAKHYGNQFVLAYVANIFKSPKISYLSNPFESNL